ncbi:YHS domain-containing protein [Alienimonas chondri]|uniref:YHS domain-containing protein n=1 Tax=Alienimonas chondri TaxID=2681879 RepID=UPI0014885943|nr:YHS domain-containing protein [Alienimonas chondri]
MPVSLPAVLLCALLPADPASGLPRHEENAALLDPATADFVPAEIAAADAPPISALGTLCVVSLAERRFEPAAPYYSAVHAGRTYFFASDQARTQFLAAPETYAPAWCGIDPVAYLNDGVLAEGAVLRRHAGRFYLFLNVTNWNTFRAAPGRYAR